MHLNRRDLLKFFGIGATIVPVLGGAPRLEMPAKLIAEPVLDPVQIATSTTGILKTGDRMLVTFDYLNLDNGTRWRFECPSVIVESRCNMIDVTNHTDYPFRRLVKGGIDTEWSIRGIGVTNIPGSKVRS